MPSDLVIFGAWYLSQVVAEAAEVSGWHIIGYIDPEPPNHVSTLRSIPSSATVIVAVGENSLRARLCAQLVERRRTLATIVHPSAVVSRSASIGHGCYLGENVVVRSNSVLGNGVLVNAGAVVSHHCDVGDFVTLGPNAASAGHVMIGAQTTIGVGASIRPRVRIGCDCEIGAGAAVVKDVKDGMAALGVPARVKPKQARTGKQSDWSMNTAW